MAGEISKQHPDYVKARPSWDQIKVCIDGEKAIKDKGEDYLPYPVSIEDNARTSAAFTSQYAIYLAGAHFVSFTSDAVDDLAAAAFRAPVVVEPELPPELDYIDVPDLVKELLPMVVSFGRAFVLVDYPTVEHPTVATDKTNKAFYELYHPLDVINWDYQRRSGEKVLTRVVIQEVILVDGEDEVQYRELKINDAGFYEQAVYKEDDTVVVEPFEPIANGQKLDHIPGIFIGVTSNTPNVDKSPVIGISNTNIKHYQTTAELMSTQTYVGHPQMVLTGLAPGWIKQAKKEGTKITLDASQSLALEGETARAELLELNAGNLIHFKTLEMLESMMQEQGLMLKGGMNKSGVESAEAIKLRYSGSISKLGRVAENVELAANFILVKISEFMATSYEPDIAINKEFLAPTPDAALITSLSAAETSGTVPTGTTTRYAQTLELVPADVIPEDVYNSNLENDPNLKI